MDRGYFFLEGGARKCRIVLGEDESCRSRKRAVAPAMNAADRRERPGERCNDRVGRETVAVDCRTSAVRRTIARRRRAMTSRSFTKRSGGRAMASRRRAIASRKHYKESRRRAIDARSRRNRARGRRNRARGRRDRARSRRNRAKSETNSNEGRKKLDRGWTNISFSRISKYICVSRWKSQVSWRW